MDLHVDLQDRRDVAGQIYRGLRARILDGRLRDGEQVPPSRELAQRLGVSRNTVGVAYEWLTAEGLLVGRGRAGSFVQNAPRERGARAAATRGVKLRPRAVWSELHVPPPAEPPAPYDFRVGNPDAALFPFEAWHRLLARHLRAAAMTAAYADPAGHPELREAVARHVGVSRGVRAEASDVLITHGAQQALDLAGRVLLEPGDRVAVEEPGYPPARLLFQSLGAHVVPVPVDKEGLDVQALPDDTRLVYVTPSHQFPLGIVMSPARRRALLDWARRRDAVVIEDDYDSEFRFGGRPLETLHSLDRSGRVLYVGSFSKVLLPALRLGFLVAPPSLQRELRLAKQVTDWHSQLPAQAALARFIDTGALARHLRKTRREYEQRHTRLSEKLRHHFGDALEQLPSVAGLHLCVTFTRGGARLERELTRRARDAGIGIEALSGYFAGAPTRHGWVLGYGGVTVDRIDEGLWRLRTRLAGAL
ncbi:transcriptional regulator, GntR family [Myxococcus xanthus DK 1622]|uniref:Transcriptional regulator, GntR family n=1 Tax=Myxococcus xanthus (strain DK1622) TaxID=246197 RepID=Q1DEU8_MYXXD|nr:MULTISPECIES: PLP-dependent aminotransferase family protein [Myxococcus]ABF86680.1 transcriptional regulator, GntR family [Myxococcus xanthus DK 1622]NOJ57241.1 PLP-dependent aminotransferase family protein [Myxococcus xanthus]QPM80253.1 PLP-dependent aminotransferase family protein [Myxococcus xanthus]QVW69317.1 PLP-dependent aminotransferase family protein [Myxococcus xanthus DZ2]QZZ48100.1 HTH-type transcriptional regulatory protein GabR [Myxococcus xanthus]